ncbi:MAG TPA: type II toxin-antitoxin system VapC family toxin [Candidatus Dormibacteraeota bacterium]|nr:type II toxin-antitoxin system VapC family toxin [Candidatus Dormibacteraeota bacterium]
MPLLIDASATVAWLLPDEFDAAAESLLDEVSERGAIVPALWSVEIENALRSAQRRRRITLEAARAILVRLGQLPIRVVDCAERPTFCGALSLSVECDISVYDAVYLDTARRHRARFASRDRRLLDAAQQLGIAIF